MRFIHLIIRQQPENLEKRGRKVGDDDHFPGSKHSTQRELEHTLRTA